MVVPHKPLSYPSRDQTCVACIGSTVLTTGLPRKLPDRALKRKSRLREVDKVKRIYMSSVLLSSTRDAGKEAT